MKKKRKNPSSSTDPAPRLELTVSSRNNKFLKFVALVSFLQSSFFTVFSTFNSAEDPRLLCKDKVNLSAHIKLVEGARRAWWREGGRALVLAKG